MGIPYARSSHTTDAETIALNALVRLAYVKSNKRGQSSPAGSQENQSKNNDQGQVEIQGVQRNLELGVNFGEPFRKWKTAVTGWMLV